MHQGMICACLSFAAIVGQAADASIRIQHWTNPEPGAAPIFDQEVVAGGLGYSYDPTFVGDAFQPSVSGNVSATASYGTVRSRVDLTVTVQSAGGSFPVGAYSRVRTEFSDQVLIDSSTESGSGTGTWLFAVHGGASTTPPSGQVGFGFSRSYAKTSAEINGFDVSAEAESLSTTGQPDSESFDQIVALPFSFTFGETFALSGVVETTALIEPAGGGPWQGFWSLSADADFSRTFEWIGVGDVFNANGDLVTDYGMTSQSGTDWTTPTPGTVSLLVMAAAGGMRRTRVRA